MAEVNTSHTASYWLYRINEMIIQYNILSDDKIEYSNILENVGEDINKAIEEYGRVQQLYIKFINENYIQRKEEKHI